MVRGPAARPCGTCPYRLDVPSGIWDASEYEKLPAYDRETGEQPIDMFQCHQHDAGDPEARICAGWIGCHGDQLLALRIWITLGRLDPDVLDYTTPTPLHPTGAAAAAHGMAEIHRPNAAAVRAIWKVKLGKAVKRR